jgi:hypothetical protein
MILILFLASVGLLELILWKDRKKNPSAGHGSGPTATDELLRLMRAVEKENARPVEGGRDPQREPEYHSDGV